MLLIDIGEFCKGNGKNIVRRASRHQSAIDFETSYFTGKVSFSERVGLLIILMPRIIYLFFTVKLLPDGPNTHFKMTN
jgi:hypothetical protein